MSNDRRADDERLIRIETILETHLIKVVEGLDSLKELQLKLDRLEKLEANFDVKVSTLISNRLNTIEFDKAIKDTIYKEVKIIFENKEVRENFQNQVKDIFKEEFKRLMLGVYIKITLVAGAIATTLASSIIQGFTGGK